jgi:hypothetical protein
MTFRDPCDRAVIPRTQQHVITRHTDFAEVPIDEFEFAQ